MKREIAGSASTPSTLATLPSVYHYLYKDCLITCLVFLPFNGLCVELLFISFKNIVQLRRLVRLHGFSLSLQSKWLRTYKASAVGASLRDLATVHND